MAVPEGWGSNSPTLAQSDPDVTGHREAVASNIVFKLHKKMQDQGDITERHIFLDDGPSSNDSEHCATVGFVGKRATLLTCVQRATLCSRTISRGFRIGPQRRDVQRAEAKITPQQACTVRCVELSAVPVPSRALLLCSLGIVL